MNSQFALKEPKKHGNYDFTFEKYDISSDYVRQFATTHWHDETEIIHVKKGSVKITINGKSFIGNEDSIFIVNSGEIHEIEGLVVPLSYSAYVFDFNMLSFKTKDAAEQKFITPILDGNLQFANCIKPNKHTITLLKYIYRLNSTEFQTCTLATKASLLQFFALLIEENQFTLCETQDRSFQKSHILKGIVKYISENYSHEISLQEIAKQFNMSYKYFCRFFKNNFQKTFIEYLNDVRLENAIRMFENEDISVTEAAIFCGFSNMSYFTRTFKKKVGCTPSQYKKSTINVIS